MIVQGGASAGTDDTASVSGQKLILPGYRLGFLLVTSLFFLWAIANNLNDILIRQFQKALSLDRAEAGFIQFVFYFGYFVMALPAGLVMRRFGYRIGIVAGLGLYAAGALLFWPAAEIRQYWAFLGALFVIAAGAAFLETAANPFIVAFGDASRASQRLNFAQSFNGLGAVIAPIIGGLFIFSGVEHSRAALDSLSPAALAAFHASEARMVVVPYLVLAAAVLGIAAAIATVRLPPIARPLSSEHVTVRGLLRHRGLMAAVVAQFFYVGAQVGIWSFFVDFTKDMRPDTPERVAAFLLSASLVLFMLGRFAGTALMQRISAPRLLLFCAVTNIALCGIAASTGGSVAIAALGLTSFFMSIMFPTIFALGIARLGPGASLGASLIIMAIIGGAVFPPLMGLVSRGTGGLRLALALPAICFFVVAIFARSHARDATEPSSQGDECEA